MAFFDILLMSCRNPLFVLLLLFSVQAICQNSVGLISYNNEVSYDGYNLFFPHNQSSVFLINNCGELVNEWEDGDFRPGNSVYLTDEGNLVKSKRRTTSAIDDPIWAGGAGEIVEILSWDNDILAEYELNDSLRRLHHDVAVMPNGHILMIAWELKTHDESLQAGRDPDKLAQDKLWPEVVLEWDPADDVIIWEWHSWDHLIQDFDQSKDNFGIVKDHPELIDLNYDEHNGHPDWLHCNSIDYNSELDQIILSIPYFNEFWIIDHSTSTEEAASHVGGNSGKGGDLLFRWGNPQTYQRGDSTNQRIFFQHDVHWVNPSAQPGNEHFNEIVLFNNRVGTLISNTNSLLLPWDQGTNAYLFSSDVYGPEEFKLTAVHPNNIPRSNSNSLSSAQLLPNDNFLICAGRWGYTYEVTPDAEVAWEYITPILRGTRAEQGDTTFSINSNLTFRLKRYGTDFIGFVDKDLTPSGYIEVNPNTTFCEMLTTSIDDEFLESMKIYPNPTADILLIEGNNVDHTSFEIIDINGKKHINVPGREATSGINVSNLRPGVYLVRSSNGYIQLFSKI